MGVTCIQCWYIREPQKYLVNRPWTLSGNQPLYLWSRWRAINYCKTMLRPFLKVSRLRKKHLYKTSILYLFWRKYRIGLGQISGHHFSRQSFDNWWKLRSLTPNSDLITAAEAINWPAVVNYTSQPLEKRKNFETAFFKLLKLQSMYVLSCWTCMTVTDIVEVGEKWKSIPRLARKKVYIPFKHL